MNPDVEVIWRRGDGELPTQAKHIVEAAQDELLLSALRLPSEEV